ncbi:hypothetical protein AXG93_4368s2000 [Marchantia polymorpha subsp. ruderalis]|uniref:MORN repeat-containing protein 3 n=1 Tax=Marchantia polymorpha subsp. ruderalis TaxID=1480154 RepID=A0A176VY54_MARPO|nr:hypothetical protein AXG93_4368s2000 [Marchantia polymorpha subsp. ruderalis]
MDSASPQLIWPGANQQFPGEKLSEFKDRISKKEGYRPCVFFVTGDLYKGEWSKNKRDGRGIHFYKSGNRYEREFKNGKREGLGTFWVIDGNRYRPTYRGHWKNNLWHGPGLLYGLCGERYDGYFEKGKRSGLGKQIYRHWESEKEVYHVYYGEWANDKRNGVGTLTLVNGNVYQGHWIDDLKHGLGVFYYKDKESKYEGLWKDDVPVCGTYSRNVRFDDDEDKLPLPMLEMANFQKLVGDLISDAWNAPPQSTL